MRNRGVRVGSNPTRSRAQTRVPSVPERQLPLRQRTWRAALVEATRPETVAAVGGLGPVHRRDVTEHGPGAAAMLAALLGRREGRLRHREDPTLPSTLAATSPEFAVAAYLNEFTFRFNRRHSRRRGLLFYRLLDQAIAADPITYGSLIVSPHPTGRRPASPSSPGRVAVIPPPTIRGEATRPKTPNLTQMDIPFRANKGARARSAQGTASLLPCDRAGARGLQ